MFVGIIFAFLPQFSLPVVDLHLTVIAYNHNYSQYVITVRSHQEKINTSHFSQLVEKENTSESNI